VEYAAAYLTTATILPARTERRNFDSESAGDQVHPTPPLFRVGTWRVFLVMQASRLRACASMRDSWLGEGE
jgi:hypothetical protein